MTSSKKLPAGQRIGAAHGASNRASCWGALGGGGWPGRIPRAADRNVGQLVEVRGVGIRGESCECEWRTVRLSASSAESLLAESEACQRLIKLFRRYEAIKFKALPTGAAIKSLRFDYLQVTQHLESLKFESP